MKALCFVLALLVVAGSAFATYCTSDSDCASDEYCGDSGTCQPYFTTSTTSACCCAPAAIMLLLGILAYYYSKPARN